MSRMSIVLFAFSYDARLLAFLVLTARATLLQFFLCLFASFLWHGS